MDSILSVPFCLDVDGCFAFWWTMGCTDLGRFSFIEVLSGHIAGQFVFGTSEVISEGVRG